MVVYRWQNMGGGKTGSTGSVVNNLAPNSQEIIGPPDGHFKFSVKTTGLVGHCNRAPLGTIYPLKPDVPIKNARKGWVAP